MKKFELIVTDMANEVWDPSNYYNTANVIWTETMPDCDYLIEIILDQNRKTDLQTKIDLETINSIIKILKNNIHVASEFASQEWINAIRGFQKAKEILEKSDLYIHCLFYYIG